jgi:hypothetical protein
VNPVKHGTKLKTVRQQNQMEEFDGCRMVQKELQELNDDA